MFKKPGVRVGCQRDMGNASERMGSSERYDDGGDPEGRVGMRWPGSTSYWRAGCGGSGAGVGVTMAWRVVVGTPRPYRPVRVAGRVGDGRLAAGGALAMLGRRGCVAWIRAPPARR
jgi:hypothetical protein